MAISTVSSSAKWNNLDQLYGLDIQVGDWVILRPDTPDNVLPHIDRHKKYSVELVELHPYDHELCILIEDYGFSPCYVQAKYFTKWHPVTNPTPTKVVAKAEVKKKTVKHVKVSSHKLDSLPKDLKKIAQELLDKKFGECING